MGTRELDPRLKELYDSGVPVYSISRLDCINRCLYEAYLTYKLHKKGKQNIYGVLGSRVHDTLEAITHGEKTEADLWPAVQQEFEDLDMLGIEFPKDFSGGDSIRDGWLSNMKHFCDNYVAPKGATLKTEELFIYTSPKGRKLQGYIDLQQVKKDGSVNIYDYKTSAMYKGEALKEHGRQLVVYQLGLEQMGLKVNKVAWIMLKYVTVTYEGYKTVKSKNKTTISKDIERRKIAKEMLKPVIREMEDQGFDSVDINLASESFLKNNDFRVLPESVANKFTIKPCVIEYDVTDDIKQECENYIDSTADMWESLGDDEENYPHIPFTRISKAGKEVNETFYCNSLCGHCEHCPYIKSYNEKFSTLSTEKEEEAALFT